MKKSLLLFLPVLLLAACDRQEPAEINTGSDSLKAVFADNTKTGFSGSVYSWMNADRIRVAAAEGGTIDYKYTGPASAGEVTFVKNEESSKTVLYGDAGFALYPSLSEGNCVVSAGTMTCR